MNKIFLKILIIIFAISNLQIDYIQTTDKTNQAPDDINKSEKLAGMAGGGAVIGILLVLAIKSLLFDSKTKKDFVKSVKNIKELQAIPINERQALVDKIGNAIFSGNISASDIRLLKKEAKSENPNFENLHNTLKKVITTISKDLPRRLEADKQELQDKAIFDAVTQAIGVTSRTDETFQIKFNEQVTKPLQQSRLIPEHTQLRSLMDIPIQSVKPEMYLDPRLEYGFHQSRLYNPGTPTPPSEGSILSHSGSFIESEHNLPIYSQTPSTAKNPTILE